MITDQLKSGGSLLSSIDAARNTRALGLLMATFAVCVLVIAMGWALAGFSPFLFMFVLLAYGLLFYGSNAVGLMLMDEAEGLPSRSIGAAITTSLFSAHRLLLLMLLLALVYGVGFMFLALLLFICKIPGIGPVLYAVVFPLSALLTGIAYFAMPMVILPLSAPAVWKGAGVLEALSQLMAIVRKRLLTVALLMLGVAFLAGAVAFIVFGILLTGSLTTSALSIPILGGSMDVMGMLPSMMGSMSGGYGGRFGGGVSGHLMAAGVGGGLLFAAGMTLPGLVYLKGACIVYLQAIDGLDLVAERERMQAMMDEAKKKMEEAKEKARQLQQQAEEAARQAKEASRAREAEKLRQQQAALAASPAPVAQPAPVPPVTTAPPSTPVVATAHTAQGEPLDLDLGYDKTEIIHRPAVVEPLVEPVKPSVAQATSELAPTTPVPATPPAPATLASLPQCPKCHSQVAHDDVFCGQCGFKLK